LRNHRIRGRLAGWLKDGISTETLALSIALGFVLGVFPVLGIPTVLCGVAAVVWRLNFPALQLVNYLVYPLQIALLWPFARFGERLFGAVRLARGWGAAAGLGTLALHTTAAWLCFAVPAGLVTYFTLRRVLRWHRRAVA
jgi:uncharacterized protein (DUF2062 family)